MAGEVEVRLPVSAQLDGGGESPPTQSRSPPYTIDGLRDCASWIASFAAHFDYTAAVEAERSTVEAKLRELGEREEVRAREVEEEAGRKRKELEVKEKEIELKREELEHCLNVFRIREKGFEALLAVFKLEQDEFQVRLSELDARERGIDEKEREFEDRLEEFIARRGKLDKRSGELSKREKEMDDREKGFRERFAEFEAKQMKFEESLREWEVAKEREAEELNAKEADFEEDVSRLGVKERGIEEKEQHYKELRLEMKQQAEAAGLVSAFELRTEFPSVSTRKYNQDCNLIPLLGDASIAPADPLDSRTSSGAKRSLSDASADGIHTESPDPGPVISANLPAQLPEMLNIPARDEERSSRDEASCSNSSFPINPEQSGSGNEEVPSPSTLPFVPKCLERRENNLRLLCHKIKENEFYCREVSDALELASDPAEFVLGVVKDPSSLTLKRGNEVARLAFPEYAPLLLLDCMWRMSPYVNPDVESEALSYARSWRSGFTNCRKNHLDTVCFLLFLAAYKLVSHFVQDEFFLFFNRTPYLRQNVFKLLEILGFKDLIPKSSDPLSGRLLPLCSAFPTNSKHSGLGNEQVPSPSTLLFVPKCIDMDEDYLSEYIWWQIEYNGLKCREVSDALELASDPGEFVLGVVKNPSSLTLKTGNEVVRLAFPRYGPLLLLDRMWRMSPDIKPEVKWEALSFARSWRSDLAEKSMKNNLDTACFVLFLAAYKLVSSFDQDELLCLFANDYYGCESIVQVFGILGFKDLMLKSIEYLIRDNQSQRALRYIDRSTVLHKSPSAKTMLKDMFNFPPPGFYNSIHHEIAAIDAEVKVWKAVAESIRDQNFALSLDAHILALKKQKKEILKVHKLKAIAGIGGSTLYLSKLSNDQLQPGELQQQQQRRDESRHNKRPRVDEPWETWNSTTI